MTEENNQLGTVSDDNPQDQEIMSMAELLAQQDATIPVIRTGDIIKGVVARKSSNEILVDIGAKSEGIVDSKDLSKLSAEELEQVRLGDTIYVYVLRGGDDDEDRAILSLSQAKAEQDWDEAERLFASSETIERNVIGHNKGGLIVEFGQLRGFLPGSQLITGQTTGGTNKPGRWNQMMGQELSLKIIEVDRERNRLILSERLVFEESRQEEEKNKVAFLEGLSEAQVCDGRVTRLVDFGAFVDIGGGIDGLIHLSELAWARILHPKEILKVNQEVKVYILGIDVEQKRVALSLKRLQPEPWEDVFEYYQIDQVVEAVITKLTDFGAFARIDARIEGLIHISEISKKNITHPNQVVNESDKLKVRIINIDPDRRRMGLSIKQVEDDSDQNSPPDEAGQETVEEPVEAFPVTEPDTV
ncbi:S1 RNA-binding domain-containing protein [Anaerolineales bacterium HSG6]|nr:S1 RNA-binding domain-containing protein [Anaerolineales bacterium HSG6]MDM8531511.1 S1 RNA-binding domain-containing protein [Anaerolineales bacterium HSG25]